MDHLADTNILVRAVEQGHPSGTEAINALKTLHRRGDRVCIGAQNIVEFWSVCTRPTSKNGLGLSVPQTSHHVSRMEALFRFLPDIPTIYEEWKRLVKAHAVTGMQVYDARLCAAMNVYGITRLLTFNTDDFRGYQGISAVLPREVLAGSRSS
jgi:predicted nucleic acid-binding protein